MLHMVICVALHSMLTACCFCICVRVHGSAKSHAKTVMQVHVVQEALLGHQVNYQNYYHVFIETMPTLHNTMCQFLGRCSYEPDSPLQLWFLEGSDPIVYPDLFARMPAIPTLYRCLSPQLPHHIRDRNITRKVDTWNKVVRLQCCM